MQNKKLINLEDEGNKLTVDQYNDLKVLAKQLEPDGSVKALINDALDYHQECLKVSQRPLPYFGLTTDLFPSNRENQSNTKKRDLAGRCNITLLRQVLESQTLIIEDQMMVPEDGLIGSSFTLKPRTQLGSFIYVMVLDYAFNVLGLLGSRSSVSIDDRVIEQDCSVIYFDDRTMTDGTMVRRKLSIIIRCGKKPLIGSETVSQYRVTIPTERETCQLVQQRYNYLKFGKLPTDIKPPTNPSPNSGIISSNSMDKGLLREDDDFER